MDIALEAPVAAARTLLRDACKATHARLDARLSQVNFDDSRDYAEMLSRMSAPLSALETGLTAGIAPALFTNWAARLRSHALRKDLAFLDTPFLSRQGAAVDDEAEAFGTLYVLEGSRLGGQVLAQMARSSRDPRVQTATHYFGHGARAGLWRSFLEKLESSPAVQGDMKRAKRAALRAFETFEAAFA